MSVPSVLVAGATVEGLCLAHGLRKRGVPVVVFEKDESVSVDGPKMLLRIDRLALAGLATCLPADVYDRCLQLRNALDGTRTTHYDSQLREVHDVEPTESGSIPDGTVVDLEWLRKLLLPGVHDSVRFGHRVTGYRERPGGVDVQLADGAEAHGDALVLADGTSSLSRGSLFPGFELVDTGLDAIHGHAPLDPELFVGLPRSILQDDRPILGPQHSAMTVHAYLPEALDRSGRPRSADVLGLRGFVKWTSVLPSRPGLTDGGPAVLRRIVMEQVARWHPVVRRLLEQSDWRALHATPIRASAPLQRGGPPGATTAIGSAARLVPAVGVVVDTAALQDAGRLATDIHEHDVRGVALHHERMLADANTVVGEALDRIGRTFRS